MKRAKIFAGLILGLLVLGQVAFVHTPGIEAQLAADQVNGKEAREIALRYAPGQVVSQDLERVAGVRAYSFDIQQAGNPDITEVQVSAKTSAVLGVQTESPAVEQAESRLDHNSQSGARNCSGD